MYRIWMSKVENTRGVKSVEELEKPILNIPLCIVENKILIQM